MKVIDLLKVIYHYNEIELYNDNNEYLGWYIPSTVAKEFLDKEVIEITTNDKCQLEILIKKN